MTVEMEDYSKRRICVVLVDRANYGRLKPVMVEIAAHPGLELEVIAAGSMVLERFGNTVKEVIDDGFRVVGQIYLEVEGGTPATMAKSVGLGTIEFVNEFQRVKPDLVLLIGDRYEALSATIAAAYMNLCIVHVQGGEVSGSIDESARHAMSKFSHFHYPSTRRAADYLLRMGETPESILGVGCPSSDIALGLDRNLSSEIVNFQGSGAEIDVSKPFLLTVFHPTTTEYGEESNQVEQLLDALNEIRMPTVFLWPNIDAGSDHISKSLRIFRGRSGVDWLRTLTNLSPENYLQVLAAAACAVGNSSSFVRDASFLGTPVVLVGDRQKGRERDSHVLPVSVQKERIAEAIERQVSLGHYPPSHLYGDGNVSRAIAERLGSLTPYTQKRLSFVDSELKICTETAQESS
jgi:UDP-hydrolysing UDP-N-acetyl-D-glucosamine 2-epimerase